LTGHNSYKACRYCDIRGIYFNHIYYPTTLPTSLLNEINKNYNPSNLPQRTHNDYKTRVEQIMTIPPSKARNKMVSELGVTGRSILLDIKTTQFPKCFPVDIMHLFYENIAPYMLKHWMGSFFNDFTLNNQPYVLNNNQWEEIGTEMETARKFIPTEFGRPPRNIVHHHNGYKAEEWSSWITLYSLPLLKDRLPAKYLKGWSLFVRAVQLCQKRTLSLDNLNDIRSLLLQFYEHYEWYVANLFFYYLKFIQFLLTYHF
ncbi:hypothetical protein C1645_702044, partial [Glomus cerebriforme]